MPLSLGLLSMRRRDRSPLPPDASRRRIALISAALLAAWSSLAPSAAHAQVSSAERAHAHFEAAHSYFDDGNYEAAAPEFQRAYDLSHEPAILYNLALVHERLGNLQLARDNLRAFLDAVPGAENRESLEAKLRNFEARLARVGGGAARPATGADRPATGADRPAEPTASTPARADVTADTTPSPEAGVPVIAIASFIAAGAGLLTLAVFGPLALSEYNAVEDRCGARVACLDGDLDTTHTFALVADVGLGVALVGSVMGVLSLLLSGGDAERAAATSRVEVTPVWLPGGAGLSVRGVL